MAGWLRLLLILRVLRRKRDLIWLVLVACYVVMALRT
jgi:hypothetical protein